MGNAIDYGYYKMSIMMKTSYFTVAFMIGMIVGWIFYENIILSTIVAITCGFGYLPIKTKGIIKKRQNKLLLEFKDMLESISTSLGAGSNVQIAFAHAQNDMEFHFGKESYIYQEVVIINEGIHNSLNVEQLLMDFANRSQLIDIMNFANVFETCYRKGGNIQEVIHNTYEMICDKIEIALEIRTVVASKTNEQNIMLVMPIVFAFLIKMLGSDLVDLKSFVGIASTTAAIVIFVIAYFMSKKILNIEV